VNQPTDVSPADPPDQCGAAAEPPVGAEESPVPTGAGDSADTYQAGATRPDDYGPL
jgi:hypothetical protein